MFRYKKLLALCIIFLGLLAFTNNTRAANPPTGCTGSGADSGWASPTEYIGYYACHVSPDDCPGLVSGWSRSTPVNMGLNTHGCVGGCSPCALGPSCCAVGKIVWDKLPDAICSISASPSSFMSGTPTDVTVSWTLTNATNPALNGTPVALSDSQTFTGVSSSTTYKLTGTDLSGNPVSCSAQVSTITPPTGGLIPCGRMANDPATGIDESKPCDLCSIFYMVKNIFNFILADIAIPVAVLLLVISGLLYAFSAGNPRNAEKAKIAIKYTLMGLIIIFLAWIFVAFFLQMLGYSNMATWNQVSC